MALLQGRYIIFVVRELKNALFLAFFPLWDNIYPYINRGRNDGTSDKAEAHRLGFNSTFSPEASARYGTRFTLGCTFKIEVQKKEGSPRKIRNLLVILLE